jgi:broad specificity phosphatase PhoE
MNKEKIVYLVRHGESEGNIAARSGDGTFLDYSKDSPLTEVGKLQAEKVGNFLKDLNRRVEIIISSPYLRASDTAKIINNFLEKEIIYSDLCIEAKGVPDLKEIKEDKEIVHKEVLELRKRVFDFFKLLEEMEQKEIVVVSHGFFIRAILISILHGHDLDQDIKEDKVFFHNFLHGIAVVNTGVCIMNYSEKHKTESKWRVQAWNMTGHLKEL